MIILSLILCLAASAPPAASPAAFETFEHKEGGIQFTAPDDWKAEAEGDQLTVSPADGSLGIVFWVPEGDTFEAALEALDEELAKTVKNMKLDGEPRTGTHNGMDHASLSGTGTIDGDATAFSVDLLMAKRPVIMLTFASPADFAKHEPAYRHLVKSIRKID